MKHEVEQELLNEYSAKFEAYIRVCHLMEKVDNEIFQLALNKATGQKMLMNYRNILPEQKTNT